MGCEACPLFFFALKSYSVVLMNRTQPSYFRQWGVRNGPCR